MHNKHWHRVTAHLQLNILLLLLLLLFDVSGTSVMWLAMYIGTCRCNLTVTLLLLTRTQKGFSLSKFLHQPMHKFFLKEY